MLQETQWINRQWELVHYRNLLVSQYCKIDDYASGPLDVTFT